MQNIPADRKIHTAGCALQQPHPVTTPPIRSKTTGQGKERNGPL